MKSLWTLLRAEWDRATGVVLVIGGAVALFLGYQGVADSPFVSAQLPYIISGGFGGVLLCGVGVALLVMADLHDEWRKLDRIEDAIVGHRMSAPFDSPDPSPPKPVTVDRHRAGIGAGMVLGLALLATGWARAAGSTRPAVGYQGVAVGSSALVLTLATIAAAIVSRRAELTRRRTVLLSGWLSSRPATPPPAAETTAGNEPPYVFIAPGSRRFHRSRCPALAGLDPAAVERDAVPSGLVPCGICGAS